MKQNGRLRKCGGCLKKFDNDPVSRKACVQNYYVFTKILLMQNFVLIVVTNFVLTNFVLTNFVLTNFVLTNFVLTNFVQKLSLDDYCLNNFALNDNFISTKRSI